MPIEPKLLFAKARGALYKGAVATVAVTSASSFAPAIARAGSTAPSSTKTVTPALVQQAAQEFMTGYGPLKAAYDQFSSNSAQEELPVTLQGKPTTGNSDFDHFNWSCSPYDPSVPSTLAPFLSESDPGLASNDYATVTKYFEGCLSSARATLLTYKNTQTDPKLRAVAATVLNQMNQLEAAYNINDTTKMNEVAKAMKNTVQQASNAASSQKDAATLCGLAVVWACMIAVGGYTAKIILVNKHMARKVS